MPYRGPRLPSEIRGRVYNFEGAILTMISNSGFALNTIPSDAYRLFIKVAESAKWSECMTLNIYKIRNHMIEWLNKLSFGLEFNMYFLVRGSHLRV